VAFDIRPTREVEVSAVPLRIARKGFFEVFKTLCPSQVQRISLVAQPSPES
jgi:hypothetical protein